MSIIGDKFKATISKINEKFQGSNAQVIDSVKNQKMFDFDVAPNADTVSITKRVIEDYHGGFIIREYNEAGQVTKYIKDAFADGYFDYIKTWEYNEAGQITKYTVDENGDGKADYIKTWEYNEAGQETKSTVDENGDGKADYIKTW